MILRAFFMEYLFTNRPMAPRKHFVVRFCRVSITITT